MNSTILVVFSYHHHNTEKIARVMAKVLDCPVTTPGKITPALLGEYGLTGFGSGIYSGSHHPSLIRLADNLPQVPGRKAFIFSTCGVPVAIAGNTFLHDYTMKCHAPLREKLRAKGYEIIGEFSCAGFNTNSFLRFFGGLNRGRPGAKEFRDAEEFARDMKRHCGVGNLNWDESPGKITR